jgi:hypothetical protein
MTMKKVIVSVACCALIAPLAFAKDPKQNRQASAAMEQGVTVSAPNVTTAVESGEAASYQPSKTLVIRETAARDPGRYVLEGPNHILNSKGEIVRTKIGPGTRVRVHFASANGVRTIDHVVVD